MSIVFATRPPPGQQGRRLTVTTNLFPLEYLPKDPIHHYEIIIEPVPKGNVEKRNYEIMDKLQTYVAPYIFQPRASYDGRSNLYAPIAYSFGPAAVFDVLMSSRQPVPAAPSQGHFRVTVTLVATYSPRMLLDFIRGQVAPAAYAQVVNCLNVIVRQSAIQKFPHRARSIYTPEGHEGTPAANRDMDLGNGLVLCRGYLSAIRPAVGRCFLLLNTTTGVMWAPGSLLNAVMAFLGVNNVRDLEHLPDRAIRALNTHFKGLSISWRHPGHEVHVRRIYRFDATGADTITLEGSDTTIQAYLVGKYNVHIRFPTILSLWLSPKIAVPIELCSIEKNQLSKRKVPRSSMKKMLAFATQRPADRLKSIRNGLAVMQYANSDYMRQSGISVSPIAYRVSARVLPSVTIQFANGTLTVENGVWSWKGMHFFDPARIDHWAVILLDAKKTTVAKAKNFVKAMVNSMRGHRITVNDDDPLIHIVDPHNLEARFTEIGLKMKARPQLFLIISSGSSDLYNHAKHLGDIKFGVATQIITEDKALNPSPQLCSNIINVKLGGVNHVPLGIEWIKENSCIVMGADTSHPGPGETGKPTISALTAAMDFNASVYIAASSVQRGRQEIIDGLSGMVQYAVDNFRQYQTFKGNQDNAVPKSVLFYRDGISEGQFREVCETEVSAIRAAFVRRRLPVPKITFVVVGKRHHFRPFPDEKDADRSTGAQCSSALHYLKMDIGNAPAGLIVDTDIVHPNIWDFYLTSHAGILGTSRPMHASVLIDENGFTSDRLQKLSHALTHNLPRSSRAISIPSPVYHAHLVCGRYKVNFGPTVDWDSDVASAADEDMLEFYGRAYQRVHKNLLQTMYWM